MFIRNSKPGSEREVFTGLLEWFFCVTWRVVSCLQLRYFLGGHSISFRTASDLSLSNSNNSSAACRLPTLSGEGSQAFSKRVLCWSSVLLKQWSPVPFIPSHVTGHKSSEMWGFGLTTCLLLSFLYFPRCSNFCFAVTVGYIGIWRSSLHDSV